MSAVVGNGVVSAGCFDTVSNYAIAKDSSWLFSLIAWLFKTDGFKKVENSCLELKVAGITDFSKENINAIPAMRSNGISISKENVNAFLRAKKLNNGGVVASETDVKAVFEVMELKNCKNVKDVDKGDYEVVRGLLELSEKVNEENMSAFLRAKELNDDGVVSKTDVKAVFEVMELKNCKNAKDVDKGDYEVARRLLELSEKVNEENMSAFLRAKELNNGGVVSKTDVDAVLEMKAVNIEIDQENFDAFLRAKKLNNGRVVSKTDVKAVLSAKEAMGYSDVGEVTKESYEATLKLSEFDVYVDKESINTFLIVMKVRACEAKNVTKDNYMVAYELLEIGKEVNEKNMDVFLKASDFYKNMCDMCYMCYMVAPKKVVDAVLKAADVLHGGDASGVSEKEYKAVYELLDNNMKVDENNINVSLIVLSFSNCFLSFGEEFDAVLKAADVLHKGDVNRVSKEECGAVSCLPKLGMKVDEKDVKAFLKAWEFSGHAGAVSVEKKNVDAVLKAADVLHKGDVNRVSKEECEAVSRLPKLGMEVDEKDVNVFLKAWKFSSRNSAGAVRKEDVDAVLKAARMLHNGKVNEVDEKEYKAVYKLLSNSMKVDEKNINVSLVVLSFSDCSLSFGEKFNAVLKAAGMLHNGKVNEVDEREYSVVCGLLRLGIKVSKKSVNAFLKAWEFSSHNSAGEVKKEDVDAVLKAAEVLHNNDVDVVSEKEYVSVRELLSLNRKVNKKNISASLRILEIVDFPFSSYINERGVIAVLKVKEILHRKGNVSKVSKEEYDIALRLLEFGMEVSKENVDAVVKAQEFLNVSHASCVWKKDVDAVLKTAGILHKGDVSGVDKKEYKSACRLLDEKMEVNEENIKAFLKVWEFYDYKSSVDDYIRKEDVNAVLKAAEMSNISVSEVTKEDYGNALKAAKMADVSVSKITEEDYDNTLVVVNEVDDIFEEANVANMII